jgi:hypothetical protein
LPHFGSKIGQKWIKCTSFTIKPVHKLKSKFIEKAIGCLLIVGLLQYSLINPGEQKVIAVSEEHKKG